MTAPTPQRRATDDRPWLRADEIEFQDVVRTLRPRADADAVGALEAARLGRAARIARWGIR